MKLSKQLELALDENLPKKAKVGKKYSKVLVDGETFKNMTLIDINPAKAEMYFESPDGKHTFNYVEQEVQLS